MNLDKKRLSLVLLFTCIAVFCFPVLLPSLRLAFFIPLLVILFYQCSLQTCLWAAFCCGLTLDLLSSNMRLGLYALGYCLTTWLLYGQKRHFFADSISTLPLMTFLFSATATAIQLLLVYIFEQPISISWRWFLTDLFYMPAADALYAFIIFILPSWLFGKRPRRGSDYFFEKS